MLIRFCLLLVLVAAAASAQEAPGGGNFATVEVALEGVVPVRDSYDGLWTVSPGGALRTATPFYGGPLHLRLHGSLHDSPDPELPEFVALRAEMGWGYRLALPAGVRLAAGPQVGVMTMRFDDDEVFFGALQNETELVGGLWLRLDAPLAGRVRAVAGAEWTHVYTNVPIDLGFVWGGLSLTADTPDWLRRLLR